MLSEIRSDKILEKIAKAWAINGRNPTLEDTVAIIAAALKNRTLADPSFKPRFQSRRSKFDVQGFNDMLLEVLDDLEVLFESFT